MDVSKLVALAVGHFTHDRCGDSWRVGGSVLYASKAWRALGLMPHIVTAVGSEFRFEDRVPGIAHYTARSGNTTAFENRYTAGGMRQQMLFHRAPPIEAARIPAQLAQIDILFLAPVIGELDVRPWIEAVNARWVGVGAQGFMRRVDSQRASASGRSVQSKSWAVSPADLAGVDVVFLSEQDLVGQRGTLERLKSAVPLVVLTRGAGGCTLYAADETTNVGAFPVEEVDPTGAGDTFAAGFLVAMAEGLPPVDAARFGAALASFVVCHEGARLDCDHTLVCERMCSISNTAL